MSGARSGETELTCSSLIKIWRRRTGKKFPQKPGGFGQHKVGSCVEVVPGCLSFALDHQLCLEFGVCICGVKTC